MKRRTSARLPMRVFIDTARGTDYDDDGFLSAQIDADGQTGVPALEPRVNLWEVLHPLGIFSRGLDADVDGTGQVSAGCDQLHFEDGSEDLLFNLGDARVVPILATAQKGETILYGAKAGNFVRCHADGRVSRMSTTDGTPDGQTLFDELGPEGYLCKTPWSLLRNDATGLHYECGAATLDMGQIAGVPAPFSAFSSYCDIQAHTIRFLGAGIQLGVGAGALPVARATPITSALTAISAALAAIQTSLAALGNNGATVPVGAAVTAIAAALTTIPSTSTTAT